MEKNTIAPVRAASAVLRPGTLTGLAGLQALGLARFADDPGAQGAAGAAGGEQGAAGAGVPAGGDGEQGEKPDLSGLGPDWQMSDLPEPVQEYIRGVRAESKKDRTTQQENAAQKAREEMLQKVAQAVGLADEKPTLESLQEQNASTLTRAETAESRLAEFERRDAIRAAAESVAVSANAALALKDTDAAFADVDLSDAKAVQDALLVVADKHPHIKVASTVDQSGGDFQNGSGRPATDPKDLNAAIGSYYQ